MMVSMRAHRELCTEVRSRCSGSRHVAAVAKEEQAPPGYGGRRPASDARDAARAAFVEPHAARIASNMDLAAGPRTTPLPGAAAARVTARTEKSSRGQG